MQVCNNYHLYNLFDTHYPGITNVIFLECNIAELGNDSTISDESNSNCDLPFMSLGIKGGFVCYTGVAVGSTAVYYCSSCNFNTLKGSTVRICMENGSWSGIMPQCDCK